MPYTVHYFVFTCSFTEEVLPEELSKIFATFDRTVASLDKKHAHLLCGGGSGVSGGVVGKIAAYAPVKSRRTAGKGECNVCL